MRGLMAMPGLAVEALQFQSNRFHQELSLSFDAIGKLGENKVEDSDEVKSLVKLMRDVTGLNISLDIINVGPAVEIPKVDRNNILVNSFLRNFISSSDGLRMISNAASTPFGSVNLRTGEVSGVFSEISSTMYLPAEFLLSTKFTAEEKAAVALHEIGHLFTYYEFMARIMTANQALAGAAKALDGSGTVDERKTVLISVQKALKLSEEDLEGLSQVTNGKVTEVVIISALVKKSESELGSNIYDQSTWEYLADQYAARQGAGRHLATALDKMMRGNFLISYRNIPVYLAMEALKAVLLFTLPGIAIMLIAMDGAGDGTYDRPGDRLKRIRSQLTEHSKVPKLTDTVKETIEADIKVIDGLLENIEDRRQWMGVIWDFVIPSARRARSQKLLQQELEQLVSNDLFNLSLAVKNAKA